MLIQTKRIIENLIACGIKRTDFSVRTPYIKRLEGYGKTNICIYSREYDKAKFVLRLRKYFDLYLTVQGKKIIHISIRGEKGYFNRYGAEVDKAKIGIYDIDKKDFLRTE